MLSSACRPASIGPVTVLLRSVCTSMRTLESGPSYTYMPPGSSVSDPAYGTTHGAQEADGNQMSDSKIMRPSKKAQYLRLRTKKVTMPLESQQQGGMLPPGCSMSDPHYSVRDPVYFVDSQSQQ